MNKGKSKLKQTTVRKNNEKFADILDVQEVIKIESEIARTDFKKTQREPIQVFNSPKIKNQEANMGS